MIRSLSAQITSIFSIQHGSPSLVIALAGGGGGGGEMVVWGNTWFSGGTREDQSSPAKILTASEVEYFSLMGDQVSFIRTQRKYSNRPHPPPPR